MDKAENNARNERGRDGREANEDQENDEMGDGSRNIIRDEDNPPADDTAHLPIRVQVPANDGDYPDLVLCNHVVIVLS